MVEGGKRRGYGTDTAEPIHARSAFAGQHRPDRRQSVHRFRFGSRPHPDGQGIWPSRYVPFLRIPKPDDHAHNVFIVKNAPRTKIAKETTKGVNWGLNVWHKVRLERKLSDGTIKVFFDDLAKPIMVAEDKTFGAGRIGFGSFDDTGRLDNIRI